MKRRKKKNNNTATLGFILLLALIIGYNISISIIQTKSCARADRPRFTQAQLEYYEKHYGNPYNT